VIGVKVLPRSRPATSTGRVKSVRGGAGRCKIAIPRWSIVEQVKCECNESVRIGNFNISICCKSFFSFFFFLDSKDFLVAPMNVGTLSNHVKLCVLIFSLFFTKVLRSTIFNKISGPVTSLNLNRKFVFFFFNRNIVWKMIHLYKN
jgi:hypothetical protein